MRFLNRVLMYAAYALAGLAGIAAGLAMLTITAKLVGGSPPLALLG